MTPTQLQLSAFGDPQFSSESLLHRLGYLRECVAPAMARRMNYYRNPATPLASFLPSARSLTLNARLYRQYQEVGLPTRITGFRQTPDGLPIPAGALDVQRKEVVIENDIAWRINTIADFAVGEMPIINSTSPDAAKRQRIGALLQSILTSNGGATLLTQMVLLGVIHGVSYLSIRPQEELLSRLAKNTGGTPVPHTGTPGEAGSDIASIDATPPADDAAWASCVRFSIVEAPRVLPFIAKHSFTSLPELAYAAILPHAQQPDAGGAPLQISALRRIAGWLRGAAAPQPGADVVGDLELWGAGHWQRYASGHLADQAPNPMGFVPVIPFIHHPTPPAEYDWIAGTSEVDALIPLQDELNTRLSDRANRVTLQSFRMYLARGVDNFTSRPVGPGQMWQTDNPDAAIETFGGDASCPSEDNHIQQIREAMDKVSAVPPVAAGSIQGKVGHLTSAVALRITLIALLARTQKRRASVEHTLQVVCARVLELLDAAGVVATDPVDRAIDINWPSAIPESLLEQLDIAQRKVALGIPRDVVLAELGYSELNPPHKT